MDNRNPKGVTICVADLLIMNGISDEEGKGTMEGDWCDEERNRPPELPLTEWKLLSHVRILKRPVTAPLVPTFGGAAVARGAHTRTSSGSSRLKGSLYADAGASAMRPLALHKGVGVRRKPPKIQKNIDFRVTH
ncbi:hypothetical protein EVAR_35336_1 [Eumeta japonica]|uniref:Uncharacterized protein n=1 Tax=Eumeta variegata TaxID=151549 RepID=A0A4C1XHS2_EUMVA|nr:hypothetical protein EVAR_35336_1 [Eumeta japonica]